MFEHEEYDDWIYLTNLIKKYLKENSSPETCVVEYQNAQSLKKLLNLELTDQPVKRSEFFSEVEKYLKYSVRTSHPQFHNQLYGGVKFENLVAELLISVTNTSMATFEISPVATLIEKKLISQLCSMIGFEEGEGIMLTGGSNANLMAIHCARNKEFPNIKERGNPRVSLNVFVSKEAHYSFKKAMILLGLGTDNLISIKANKHGEMDCIDLESEIKKSLSRGATPLMIASTAGTTVLGAFDSIKEIDQVAKKYKIWHHLDGAWGGATLFSDKLKKYLDGVSFVDSFTFDAHKLLGAGLMNSFFLLQSKGVLHAANSSGGKKYLFHEYENSEYDFGDMSLQCGRKVDSLKFWLMWKHLGTKGLGDLVDTQYEKARYFESLIRKNVRFRLIHSPRYLNVCFQVLPLSGAEDINLYNQNLREKIVKTGKVLINFSSLDDGTVFFRMVFANTKTSNADLEELLKTVVSVAGTITS